MITMPIGKYSGKYLYELDGSYLLWCPSQGFFYEKYRSLWNAIGKEAERRGFRVILAEIATKQDGEVT
jgi:uncharacterized protein (DUF3820 family)